MRTFGDEQDIVVLRDAPSGKWLVFREPRDVILTHEAHEVAKGLRQLEAAVSEQGLHAAGFLAYEAAPGFDPALRVRVDQPATQGSWAQGPRAQGPRAQGSVTQGFPLLWFGLYDRIEDMECLASPPDSSLPEWAASISEQEYRSSLEAIREHLRQGNTYQVNFSFRLHAALRTDPWDFFQTVCGVAPAPYAAYVGLEDWAVCCFSPELFFSLDGQAILSKPMKGTRPRGMTLAEDRRLAEELRRSAKDRAENVMIVDMVRNDLGRVALPGSVRPLELFAVEKHATVWQMTSSVAAYTNRPLAEIFAALFPPASITGAPKAATMGIIADLETTPRRIYTGCIGYFGPGRKARFNVAIRTVLVDKQRGLAEYGVGGGIVWDSDSRAEYEECRTKARVLSRRPPAFDLLETMLWTPGSGLHTLGFNSVKSVRGGLHTLGFNSVKSVCEGYILLGRHLDRLCASAEYFDFSLDVEAVRAGLRSLAETFAETLPETLVGPRLVRLLLSRHGQIRIEDLPPPPKPATTPRVTVAAGRVDSNDPFLYHKTTHRATYEKALAARPGFDDVLLCNEREEVTESTRANVLVRMDGRLYTPPITCGLLAGTMRAHLLEQGGIVERVLSLADLARAEEVLLVNSVRGVVKVELVLEAYALNTR